MNTLSEKIAELRKAAPMTQEEFAERLGVSPQAVSRWENSITMPDILLLPLIAEVFNVTIDDLFSESKVSSKTISFKDMPKATYKAVLRTLCRCEADRFADMDGEKSVERFMQLHDDGINAQIGIGPCYDKADSLYVTQDIAVAYLREKNAADELFDDEITAQLFAALSNRTFRKALAHLYGKNHSVTRAFLKSKIGSDECEVQNALDHLIKLRLVSETEIDDGNGGTVKVFIPCPRARISLILIPMLKLAKCFTDNNNDWEGLMA